jgi:hypothetical protein
VKAENTHEEFPANLKSSLHSALEINSYHVSLLAQATPMQLTQVPAPPLTTHVPQLPISQTPQVQNFNEPMATQQYVVQQSAQKVVSYQEVHNHLYAPKTSVLLEPQSLTSRVPQSIFVYQPGSLLAPQISTSDFTLPSQHSFQSMQLVSSQYVHTIPVHGLIALATPMHPDQVCTREE